MFYYYSNSCNEPPRESDPVSPMKILAGGALYQRKPKHDPTIDPQKIETPHVGNILNL